MTSQQLKDNIELGLYEFVAKILNYTRGNTIDNIYLKTNNSIELLIYERDKWFKIYIHKMILNL